VIYVADVDTLADFYVTMREAPIVDGVEYRYQNMSFVLNIVDALANVDTYLGLRNRKIDHKTLAVVEKTYENAMQKVFNEDQQLKIEMTNKMNEAQNEVRQKIRPTQQEIQKLLDKKEKGLAYDSLKLSAKQGLLEQQLRDQNEKYQNKQAEFENERREAKRRIDLDAELEIQKIQRQFKLAAVVIPPIPPLLVGLIVFTRRRLREREGISKARRLK
jgi:ABC-2 type transport system permease protein